MELGNLLFGKSSKDCTIPFEREINQELFYDILYDDMKKLDYDVDGFDNETFTIIPYDWGECEEEDVEPNFYHKPSGFKISWYKYPLRDSYCNMEITYNQFRSILYDCFNSLNTGLVYDIDKWWEYETPKSAK